MIKRAETCETRRQEIFNVREIFNFLNDEQINVFRNTEKINKKMVSLTYSIIFNETYIYICVCVCVRLSSGNLIHLYKIYFSEYLITEFILASISYNRQKR